VLRHPTVADKNVPGFHRRPHRRRHVRARPDGGPLASAGRRLRRHDTRLCDVPGRGDGDRASARRSR
jgi:hypothetical protein